MTVEKKFDVAVLGLGEMGKTHVEAARKSPYIKKIYGFEPDPDRCVARASELGILPATLEEIMENPSIRLVYIASVNMAHAEQTIMALCSGKSVMCEKPMGMNPSEAREMIRVVEETGGFLQIGFELRYSRIYMKAKEWIDHGKIGVPVNIQCLYYSCEFHNRNSWRCRNTGSFLIGEKLSHYLDLQRWFFGQPVENVYSLSAPTVVPYLKSRDNHQIMTRFHGGGVGVLNFIKYLGETWKEDPSVDMLTKQSDDGHVLHYYIVGTKGAIQTDVFRRQIRRWEFGDSPECMTSRIVETVTYPPEDDSVWIHNTPGQNLRIAELVAHGLPPDMPARDAYETMRLCFAAEESENTGKIVTLDSIV